MCSFQGATGTCDIVNKPCSSCVEILPMPGYQLKQLQGLLSPPLRAWWQCKLLSLLMRQLKALMNFLRELRSPHPVPREPRSPHPVPREPRSWWGSWRREMTDRLTEERQQRLDEAAVEWQQLSWKRHLDFQDEEEMSENQSDCIMSEITHDAHDTCKVSTHCG